MNGLRWLIAFETLSHVIILAVAIAAVAGTAVVIANATADCQYPVHHELTRS